MTHHPATAPVTNHTRVVPGGAIRSRDNPIRPTRLPNNVGASDVITIAHVGVSSPHSTPCTNPQSSWMTADCSLHGRLTSQCVTSCASVAGIEARDQHADVIVLSMSHVVEGFSTYFCITCSIDAAAPTSNTDQAIPLKPPGSNGNINVANKIVTTVGVVVRPPPATYSDA